MDKQLYTHELIKESVRTLVARLESELRHYPPEQKCGLQLDPLWRLYNSLNYWQSKFDPQWKEVKPCSEPLLPAATEQTFLTGFGEQ